MTRSRFTQRALLALVSIALLFSAMAARAQVDTGTILGTVTDSAGAVIPGAIVSVTNTQTAAKMTAKTSADGRFVFTPLQIGTYTVVVEASSFKKASVAGIQLNIQQQALVNVSLQPGAVTEEVFRGTVDRLLAEATKP